MKKSDHYYEHQRKKAVRESTNEKETSITPEKLIKNPHFKDQFDPEHMEKLPRKKKKHMKKHSKRSSPKEVGFETEPDHIHHQNEFSQKIAKRKSLEHKKRDRHKDDLYKSKS